MLIKGGVYTNSWTFSPSISKPGTAGTCNYAGGVNSNLSSCVSFKPAPSESVTLQVAGTIVTQIRICANFVSIQGVRIVESTYTEPGTGDTLSNASVGIGAGDNSCLPGGAQPHDIFLDGLTYGGQVGIGGQAYNVWVHGGVATGTHNLPWQMSGSSPGPHNNGIDGVVFQGYNFFATDLLNHHMECLHMTFSGDSNRITRSVFEACPLYSIFMEAAPSQTNNVIENNFFDTSPLTLDCHVNNCSLAGNTVRFNTFGNGAQFQPTDDCALVSGNTCSLSNDRFYANLGMGCPNSGAPYGLGWISSTNVFAGSQTGICAGDATSIYSIATTLVSPSSPNYDLHLVGTTQRASTFVSPSAVGGCPATDIDGDSRPTTSNCAAGADEN